ncbi:hypothetical protein DVX31_12985, partial [Enterococcus faecium]
MATGGIEYHSTDCCQTRWKNNVLSNEVQEETDKFFLFLFYIICQIKRDKTFHLRNSKKLLMVFG